MPLWACPKNRQKDWEKVGHHSKQDSNLQYVFWEKKSEPLVLISTSRLI